MEAEETVIIKMRERERERGSERGMAPKSLPGHCCFNISSLKEGGPLGNAEKDEI